MARTVKDTKLDTRNARLKLPMQREPYWKTLDEGVSLGYMKGKRGGSWHVRYYSREKESYIKHKIGNTDDIADADCVKFLSFSQAQGQARIKVSELASAEEGIIINSNYTVADAAADYLEWFLHNRKSYRETQRVINKYILPSFGSTKVSKMTSHKVRIWLNEIITQPAKNRADKTQTNHVDSELATRRRKATGNRILTTLKAILNHALKEDKVASDAGWGKVKAFENVNSPKISFLEHNEEIRLLNGCDAEFRNLAHAALLTGCRYGELVKLTCGNFTNYNDLPSIYVPNIINKSNKERHIYLDQQGVELFERLIIGKSPDDLIFRNKGLVWGKSHQTKRIKDACNRASIAPAVSFHILRHTYASKLVSRGVPMAVVAELIGDSVTICEKHYAHLMPNQVASYVREYMPKLDLETSDNVHKLSLKAV